MDRTLQDFPITERPRERLRKVGVESLSDIELLAILLGSGGPKLNALELSQMLVLEFGNLQNLLNADIDHLKSFRYLGDAKVSSLKAVGEIARRSLVVEEVERPKLETPKMVFKFILPFVVGKKKEHLYLLSLDLNNRLIKSSLLSLGTKTQTLADVGEILRTALFKNAPNMILVHNHPSGNIEPSTQDIQLTRELAKASVYVGMNFLDHVIVSDTNYYSFKLSGLMNFNKRKEVEK